MEENVNSRQPPQQHTDYDDTSEIESCTRAVEADFEFLEHTDLDDMDFATGPGSVPSDKLDKPDAEEQDTYSKTGIATVSKWLGYE